MFLYKKRLELTSTMDVNSVFRAIKRFLARRGVVQMFVSDNFSSFIGGKLISYLRGLDIAWSHILPKSPWWGGFYERMVKTVKSAMRNVLGRARLTY